MRRLTLALVLLVGAAAKGQATAGDPGETCAAHLRDIGAALDACRRDTGSLPPHLSDLHPKYLPDLSALHCPADGSEGRPYPAWFPPPWQLKDPKLPVSYFYLYAETPCPPFLVNLGPPQEQSATLRQRSERHRRNFGDAVPLVQCHHHPFLGHLLEEGRVTRTQGLFEYDSTAWPPMLERLEADARAGAAKLAENWSLPAAEQYLLPVTEAPLGPAEHDRLRTLAAALQRHKADPAALRIAARCDAAGGRYELALAAARRAAELEPGDAGGRFLVELLRHPAEGGTGTSPPIDAYLQWSVRRRHLPGVAVAVVRDGSPVYLRGFGVANVETGSPATPDTVFRIASMTKSFVATALMMLVEEGRLSLDDPVTKHLPDAPPAWRGITVRHLVTHTSGLADVWEMPREARQAEFTSDAIVKTLAGVPPTFAPGERYQYNHGALLVGVLVERVTGQPFGEVLAEKIFRPLGMSATRLNDARTVLPNRAANYSWDDGAATWVNAQMPPENMWALADGGIVSTAADLVKWDAALYGERLLKRPALREMWAPMRLNDGTVTQYGCGWQLGSVRGHRWVGHYGLGTSSAKVSRFVEQRLTVIVLANLDRGDAPPMADEIAAMFLPPAPAAADDDPPLTARLKESLSAVAGGGDRAADFYRSLGPLRSLEFLGEEPQPAGRVRRYRTGYDRGTWLHAFALDRNARVTSVVLQPDP